MDEEAPCRRAAGPEREGPLNDPADALALARTALDSRYEFEEVIGQGGYAFVVKVRNRRLGRIEALKVLKAGEVADPDFATRFLQEARWAASLEHPNIASVYDSGETQGILWYTLRFVEGESFARAAAARGVPRGPDVARLAIPLLDALAYSHERGIVHRDVKPDNILVDRRGVPYLLDFGIAKSPGSLSNTKAGVLIGTPAFVSPEQARGGAVDGRSDLFSFGVTLYVVLSGEYPFDVRGGLKDILGRLSAPPVPLSRRRPDLEPALERIVMKALAFEPRDRFGSAREMKFALEEFLGERARGPSSFGEEPLDETAVLPGLPIVLPPPTPPTPPSPPRRRRTWPLLVGAYVVFLAAVAGYFRWPRGPRPIARDAAASTAPILATAPAPATAPSSIAAPALPPPVAPPSATPPSEAPPSEAPDPAKPPRRRAAEPPPPPSAVDPRPVRPPERLPGGDVLPPGLPAECLGALVDVSFTVGTDGVPVGAKVISRGRVECHPFAFQVVAGWRFRPARDALGRPVPSRAVAAAIQF